MVFENSVYQDIMNCQEKPSFDELETHNEYRLEQTFWYLFFKKLQSTAFITQCCNLLQTRQKLQHVAATTLFVKKYSMLQFSAQKTCMHVELLKA